jgi:hypothetical protein
MDSSPPLDESHPTRGPRSRVCAGWRCEGR